MEAVGGQRPRRAQRAAGVVYGDKCDGRCSRRYVRAALAFVRKGRSCLVVGARFLSISRVGSGADFRFDRWWRWCLLVVECQQARPARWSAEGACWGAPGYPAAAASGASTRSTSYSDARSGELPLTGSPGVWRRIRLRLALCGPYGG